MKRFKYRRDVTKLVSFDDSTGSSIENNLETISLCRRKIQQKRIAAIVKFKVIKTRSISAGCGTINSVANASEVTNMIKA